MIFSGSNKSKLIIENEPKRQFWFTIAISNAEILFWNSFFDEKIDFQRILSHFDSISNIYPGQEIIQLGTITYIDYDSSHTLHAH